MRRKREANDIGIRQYGGRDTGKSVCTKVDPKDCMRIGMEAAARKTTVKALVYKWIEPKLKELRKKHG